MDAPEPEATMSLPRTLRRTVGAAALTALAIGLSVAPASLGATPEGYGALTVEPSPPVAAAQITVDGVARNRATIVDLPLTAGAHHVCVSTTAGYLPPPCQVVEIVAGQTTAIAPVAIRSGSVHVTTEPSQSDAPIAIDATLRDTGEVRLDLAVGSHEVCFGAVTGMVAPPCEVIEVVADAAIAVVGVYQPAATEPDPAPEPEPAPQPETEPEPAPEPDPTEQASLTVALTGRADSGGGNKPWSAVVTIALRDADGEPVIGAHASGTWTTSRPATTVTSSCVTGDDGTCSVHAGGMTTGAGNSATYVVDEVGIGADVAPRSGDTSITVNRNGSVSVSAS